MTNHQIAVLGSGITPLSASGTDSTSKFVAPVEIVLGPNVITLQIDYDGTDGFTKVGTTVAVDDISKCIWTSAHGSEREYMSLGFTLSDINWFADFQIILTAGNISPVHFMVNFQVGTGAPAGTGAPDRLGPLVQFTVPQFQASGYDGVADYGTTLIAYSTSTLYYCRVQRVSATLVKLASF